MFAWFAKGPFFSQKEPSLLEKEMRILPMAKWRRIDDNSRRDMHHEVHLMRASAFGPLGREKLQDSCSRSHFLHSH